MLFVLGVCVSICPFITWGFDYRTQKEIAMYEKNPLKSEMIGYISIHKINLELPIYHGTDENVLRKGVGHIATSPLPIGTENTHSLLAGHRGLPGAQLFSRLHEMEIGDLFEINILGEKVQYKVCDVKIIKPEEVEKLWMDSKGTYVSLITCTPYGINSHRLVVTGERMEEEK